VKKGDSRFADAARGNSHLPEEPESYAISVSPDKHLVFVRGSDATGVMYGEVDLAEQLETHPEKSWILGRRTTWCPEETPKAVKHPVTIKKIAACGERNRRRGVDAGSEKKRSEAKRSQSG